jgi:flagellar hook-associated protein 3 FlgL
MQITTSMLTNQLLASIQNSLTTQSDLTQQLASGKKILAPSDDVQGTVRALDYQVNISKNNQYEANITNATNSLDQANTVLTSFSSTLATITGALSNATSATNPSIHQTTSDTVAQLRNQLLDLANTHVGNTYLFAGFKSNIQPYAAGTYAYQGDDGIANVSSGIGLSIALNVPGSSVFSYTQNTPYTTQISGGLTASYTNGGVTPSGEPIVNVNITDANNNPVKAFSFSNAIQMTDLLSTAIANNDTPTIEALQYPFSQVQNQVNSAQADVGARLNALQTQSTSLTKNTTNMQDNLSTIQDADTAALGVEIPQVNTALQALYSASAQILPMSLISFLNGSSTTG